MKHAKTALAGAILLLVAAMPSISSAQYNEQRLDRFLSDHKDLRGQLQQNPNLIYDRSFREHHPDLQGFMQKHPNVWGKLPGNNRWGAYGPDHNWHEADWWHQNNPGWMYQNHPEWARNHADWDNDGDFDEHHEWHNRDWWNDNHPDWVQQHHPQWSKLHQEHHAAKEQKYQEKHGQEVVPQANEHEHGHHGNNGHHGDRGHN